MKQILLRATGLVMLLLTPAAIFSQNLPPVAVNDTVYMCGSTITIYVQDNDFNPDGDPLSLSITAGSVNGFFAVDGGAINYTPNWAYSGLDSLVYVLCDDGFPPLCDTATVYIYVHGEYNQNESATICNGDSIFLAGQWRFTSGMYVDSLVSTYGCDSLITTTLNVITPPTGTITANGPTNFCTGDSLTLTASSGDFYLWSTGATTQSIIVSASGTYSVEIGNNAIGCPSYASITVTETAAPQATVTPNGPQVICANDSITLTANSGQSYLWSNGETTQSIVVTNSGTYSVTVDYGGCTSTSAPVTVAELPIPNADITFNGSLTICQGDSIELYATAGPYSYYWSTGDTTQYITVDTAGVFSVIITDPSGCASVAASVTVSISATPPANIIANGPTTFCQGDSVILSATNGNGWTWSTGDTTQSIVVTTAGNYVVTAHHGLCSSTSSPVTVTVDSMTTATISASGPLSFCEGDSVILTASNGTSWLWSNGETTQSIVVDTTGNYSVTVGNTSGCPGQSAVVSVTTTPAPQATITANGPTTFCQGDSVILSASNGNAWTWSTGDTTQSIAVTASGNYTVVVDNGVCSSTSAAIAVTVTPVTPATISASGPLSFCEGDSVILTASNGSSWLWSNGETTQSIVVDTTGNYTVTVSNPSGCSSQSAVVSVTVGPAPQATITPSGSTTICQGDSVTLTANSGSAYTWSTGDTTQSITVTGSGTYTVTVNYGVCSSTSAPVTVTEQTGPNSNITYTGSLTICQGDSLVLFATAGPYSYYWSTGETTPFIIVDTAGTFTVSVTDPNGCSSTSASVTVSLSNNPPAVVTASGPTTFCDGGSVTLTASNGTAWLWSNGEFTQSITVTDAGTYTVSIVNGLCTRTSVPVTVNVIPSPVASITASGSTNLCQGDSVLLTANAGSAWNWSTGETSQTISVDAAGTYSVTVFNTSGCSDTASIAVNVNPVPTANAVANGPTTFCEGGSVTLMASSGASYLWSNGDTTQAITVDTSGLYSVVIDYGSCSATSNTVAVIELPLPIAGISASGPLTFCEGGNVTLYATGGASYTWSNNSTSQNILVTDPGTYWVIASNGMCSDTSAVVVVNTNPTPTVTVTANGPTTFCQGDSVLLTANTNATSMLWSNGATTSNVYWSTSGNATVTVTDANGCEATSAAITITEVTAPVVNVTADGPTTFCQGGSVTITANGGSSWLWSNGATTQSIIVTTAGSYSVITSTTCGTDTSATFVINVDNGAPVAAFNFSNSGSTYTFANASTGASSYLWNFGDNTATSTDANPTHEFAGTGPYMVTLIASNACGSDTAFFMIDFNDGIVDGTIYNAFSPNGDGHNDSWNVPLLDYHPDNTVTIINRWGAEVWKGNNYDNTSVVFTGHNLNGEDLPDGTYYYIITYKGSEERGWVFIKR